MYIIISTIPLFKRVFARPHKTYTNINPGILEEIEASGVLRGKWKWFNEMRLWLHLTHADRCMLAWNSANKHNAHSCKNYCLSLRSAIHMNFESFFILNLFFRYCVSYFALLYFYNLFFPHHHLPYLNFLPVYRFASVTFYTMLKNYLSVTQCTTLGTTARRHYNNTFPVSASKFLPDPKQTKSTTDDGAATTYLHNG